MKKIRILSFLLTGFILTGCSLFDQKEELSSFSSLPSASSLETSSQGYEKAKELTPFSYKDLYLSQGADAVESMGKQRLLVVPVELSDYPFRQRDISSMQVGISGSAEDTGYWESLASFYEKSSYGKLKLEFTYSDIYQTNLTSQELLSEATEEYGSGNEANYVSDLMDKIVSWYKRKEKTNCQEFDADANGYIDGIILVYSCPDYSDWKVQRYDNSGFYWAYCSFGTSSPDVSSPSGMAYFWMSYDFFYEETSYPNVDSHTLIHEFGHMLGLDDYYASEDSGSENFNATGGDVMEAYNIKDHDIFSKVSFGWTLPYLVKDSCTITISPSEESGECILVPTESWNGTAFDEYLLLELYTPTGLNEKDSKKAYSSYSKGITSYGVKLWHIDARIALIHSADENTGKVTSGSYVSDIDLDIAHKTYQVASSNCYKDISFAEKDFSLIHLIEADNHNTFKNGDSATNASVFHTGDTFSLAKYGNNFFPKKTKMNNGDALPYEISFDEVTSSKATISFRKMA